MGASIRRNVPVDRRERQATAETSQSASGGASSADRDDSPWYPSVRLFRQMTSRDYADVVERVRAELAARIPARTEPGGAI
jgi:hypothetical protein